MKNITYIILALVCTFSANQEAQGQQDPMYTQYFFNPLTVNSGYTGTRDALSANLLVREQWVGLAGRPRTQTLSIHSPLLVNAIAVGGTIIRDEIGPTNSTSVFGDFAYRFKVSDKSKLAFGLKAGVNFLTAELAGLDNTGSTDVSFGQNIKNAPLPNFGISAYWWSKKYFLGLSAPKLLKNDLPDNNLETIRGRETPHAFLIGGYVFTISRALKFKPTFMARATQDAPPSLDLTANFLLDDKLWLGATWRVSDAVGAILSYQLTSQLRAGYSYDYTLSQLQNFNKGSHEFFIGYDFQIKGERFLSPRYF